MQPFFYSVVSFAIAVFFVMLGVIGILIPWVAQVRTELVMILLESSAAIYLFGLSLILIGFAIAAHVFMSVKKNYYSIKVDVHPVQVDEAVIQHYLNSYWKEIFPREEIPSRLILKKNKIHVIVDLPGMHKQEQEIILTRIKEDLRSMFGQILGYHQSFYLSASFQPQQTDAPMPDGA